MADLMDFKDKRVVVAGLGRFGGSIAAARWLAGQGARVLVTDKASPEALADSVAQLDGVAVDYRLGVQTEDDFTSADLVVASPAVAPDNQYLSAARAAGVPVTTEIRLFVERCPAPLFGVTGTKGKSTTSTLLHLMLSARFNTYYGGNIGISLLPELAKISKTDLVVLELSSYMLHYLRQIAWSPHVALFTMVTADHLEWHGNDREAYVHAKRTMLDFQRPDDYAVLSEECDTCRGLARHAPGKVAYYGIDRSKPFDLRVPGRHNQLNAQGAFAAAGVVGVTWEEAQAAVRDFKGLPHRLELVHESAGVCYYNDSIATIPEAALAALDSFPTKKVIQIVGGYDHHLPILPMCAALVERAKAVLCIGNAGPVLAGAMSNSPHNAAAPVYECGDLETAVRLARRVAAAGDVVLLSPGYKSFDQFVNFQERGEAFARLVRGETRAGKSG